MKVSTLLEHGFTGITLSDPEREINGAYAGDLLSWVMGRAKESQAWVTIMSNRNILAVASLIDLSCIILSEGVTLEEDVVEQAREKGINVLSSDLPTYETCVLLNGLIA